MVGLAEPGTGAQDAVGAQMLGLLGVIVVGDGASHGFRHTAQPLCEGNTHLPRALLAELGQPRVARGPLHSDLQGLGAFSGDPGVRLPVAGVSALLPDYGIWVDRE